MPEREFLRNQPCGLEEDLHTEFKRVRAVGDVEHPVLEEYAVGFLNSEGGSIFWGISDDGLVEGMNLSTQDTDQFKTRFFGSLHGIAGAPAPIADFRIGFHPVHTDCGEIIDDTYVVETYTPQGSPAELYWTGRGEVYLKLDAVNQKLTPEQIKAELGSRGQLRETDAGTPFPRPPAPGVRPRQANSAADKPELWREPWPRAAKAMREAGEEVKRKRGEGPHRAGLISATAGRLGGLNHTGLSPADYCYNCINQAPFSFRYPLFERLAGGRYRYLGRDARYSGDVIWNPNGEPAKPVGEWKDGDLTLWEDPRHGPP